MRRDAVPPLYPFRIFSLSPTPIRPGEPGAVTFSFSDSDMPFHGSLRRVSDQAPASVDTAAVKSSRECSHGAPEMNHFAGPYVGLFGGAEGSPYPSAISCKNRLLTSRRKSMTGLF